jgi:hypothetical protein
VQSHLESGQKRSSDRDDRRREERTDSRKLSRITERIGEDEGSASLAESGLEELLAVDELSAERLSGRKIGVHLDWDGRKLRSNQSPRGIDGGDGSGVEVMPLPQVAPMIPNRPSSIFALTLSKREG